MTSGQDIGTGNGRKLWLLGEPRKAHRESEQQQAVDNEAAVHQPGVGANA